MLGELSPAEITRIVEESFPRPPLPYLHDEQVRLRALEVARAQGTFDCIEGELAVDESIPLLTHSGFREFARTGNRTNYEQLLWRRARQIDLAAMAVYLGVDRARLYLADLLWAECESTWWTMPAHEHPYGSIDLRAAMNGFHYASICELLTNRLNYEVRDRVIREVRRRVLEEYLNPDRHFWWKNFGNNWNAVCNGAIGLTAMLIEKDPRRLAAIIREVLQGLPAFISGSTADGGCTEGPSYWRYGFSWYADFAAALYDFTGGRINIMAGEKIERICRYPLTTTIAPGQELSFADCHTGHLAPTLAIQINRFHDVPELFGLCRLTERGSLAVGSLMDLLLIDQRRYRPFADRTDRYLPDLAVAKVCSGPTTVGVKAGHNQEHHNHNDVGSLIVHRGSTFFLTDLGAPVYSRNTFSPRRYESIFCSSFGHSVPAIDGQGQGTGGEFVGAMAVDGLNSDDTKVVRVEMASAYPAPSLERLTRVIEVPPGGGAVHLTDSFLFAGQGRPVEEAFITTQAAEVAPDGRSVTIRSGADGSCELRAVAPGGTFSVTELREESAAESRAGEVVRRITFVPTATAGEVTLRFEMRLA